MKGRQVELAGSGPTVASALQDLLSELIQALGAGPAGAEAVDRSVKIRAEGADLEQVVSDLIDQVAAISSDFDERPVQIIVEGYREQAGTVRAWGIAGLAGFDAGQGTLAERAGDPVCVRDMSGCRITVPLTVTAGEV